MTEKRYAYGKDHKTNEWIVRDKWIPKGQPGSVVYRSRRAASARSKCKQLNQAPAPIGATQ